MDESRRAWKPHGEAHYRRGANKGASVGLGGGVKEVTRKGMALLFPSPLLHITLVAS